MVEIKTSSDTIEAEVADSFAAKSIGLRFRPEGKMLFPFGREKRPVIDGFFVLGTLNLYFLDSEKRVVEVGELPPSRIYRPDKASRYLLESFESLELEKADSLEFEI